MYYLVPEDLRRRFLVHRRTPIWLRAGVVFVHTPKAAGTSINDALYGRFMGHARASEISRWGSRALNALPSFAVTRNPWDRLVSAYRFARRGRGVGGAHQAWVWKPEQYQVAQFDSFERFVTEWLAERDIAGLDGIFQPQTSFICDRAGRQLVDHVGRVEDMAPTLDFLTDRLGWTPQVTRSNRSGEAIDYRSFYSSELAAIVGRIYAEDIASFRYTFQGPAD